jgi:DnaJ-domain-containing protein 1
MNDLKSRLTDLDELLALAQEDASDTEVLNEIHAELNQLEKQLEGLASTHVFWQNGCQ